MSRALTPDANEMTQPAPSCVNGQRHVIVVGGGVAGLTAALALADEGVAVTLLETRKKLGGRATSFLDTRTGAMLDNCQHVAMGCCTNYLALCRRLGALDKLEWTSRINWVEAGGRTSVMKPGLLPAPAHMTESFFAAKFLSAREKMAIARASKAILRGSRDAEDETFAQWLRNRRQPPGAIRKFWAPVVVSACNLSVDLVAAESALHVFREGFFASRRAPAMAVSRVPLLALYDPAEKAIRDAGGVVRLGVSAQRVSAGSVTTASGETLDADAVICAVPFERALRIVDDESQRSDPRFDAMRSLTHSPILGVHLSFDRPVMELPHASLVDRPTQWLFRKDERGERIHAVISAADVWMDLSEEQIGERVLEDVAACFPAAHRAKLISVRAVKEKRATFAPTPASQRARPTTTGPSGVILAGDYVQTGWPATMEGAARSGRLAADASTGGDGSTALAPSLKAGALCRLLGMKM